MDWKFYPEQYLSNITRNEHEKLSMQQLQIHQSYKNVSTAITQYALV